MKKIYISILQILSLSERKRFSTLIAADVGVSLLDIAFLAALLFVIQFYTHPDSPGTLTTINEFFKKSPLQLIVLFFATFSLKNLLAYFINHSQYRFRANVASRLSKENMLHYFDGNFHNYTSIDSSVQFRRISQQPIEFCHYILGGTQQIISQIILIGITISAILIYQPSLFLLLLLILTPPVIVTGILMKRKLMNLRTSSKPISEKSIQHLNEGLKGYIEGNLFHSEDFFTNRYYKFQSKYNQLLADQQSIQNLPTRLIEIFAILGLLALIMLNSVTAGDITVPLMTIGAFMAAAYKIIPGIVRIMNSAGQIKAYDFVLADLSKSTTTVQVSATSTIDKIDLISMHQIHFDYNGKAILKDLSLKIARGDLLGLTGNSGIGKTTAINLLLGLLEPKQGDIYINGKKADPTTLAASRNHIAYVRQESFFIHDTIAKNITFSNHYEEALLKRVIQETGLDVLINELPDGINTILSENAKNLSGGQRQLICLARALYKNVDLIILDEPFNELDHDREYELMDHLNALASKGKIILIVTHNKKMLQYCSKNISLDVN